jgi:hypothetical protein
MIQIIFRVVFGLLMLGYAIYLTCRIYRMFRYNDWSSPLLGVKIENSSRSRKVAFSLIMLPFIVFFYLFAIEILFKIDILAHILPFAAKFKPLS